MAIRILSAVALTLFGALGGGAVALKIQQSMSASCPAPASPERSDDQALKRFLAPPPLPTKGLPGY